MASNGFLRTVRVGGFDKQDVLAYVDDLTSKIYTLEAQVNDQNETIERLEKSQGSAQAQDFEGKAELEKKVEDAKNKVAELMASTDTMKVRIADYMELGQVFIEAQNTANKVVADAKANAKQMEEEAQQLQNQILDDANAQAEKLVTSAQAEADATLTSAKQNAANMVAEAKAEAEQTTTTANAEAHKVTTEAKAEAERVRSEARAEADKTIRDAQASAVTIKAQSGEIRNKVKAHFTELSDNVQKLVTTLNDLYGTSIGSVNDARDLIDEGLELVEKQEAEA